MKKLNSAKDFEWYKKEIDVEMRYDHRHNGEPTHYPCVVSSDYWDDPNGPYTYDHSFFYQEEHKCSECGHITKKFPITKEQEDTLE